MAFDLTAFIAAARAAAAHPGATARIRALLGQAISDPDAVLHGLPDLGEADETLLHEDDTVSVWHCRFHPGVEVPPHEHRMPAFIGVFQGVERNTFYRRSGAGPERARIRDVAAGEVLSIGEAGVHSVCAGGGQPSHALHVYLGALSRVRRELFRWDTGEALEFNDANFSALIRRAWT